MSFSNSVTNIARNIENYARANKSGILMTMSVISFCGGMIITAKSTLDAKNSLDRCREEMRASGKEYTKKDIHIAEFKAVAPHVVLPIISAGLGTACAIGAHKSYSYKIAGLTAAYEMLKDSNLTLIDKVKEEIGEKKFKEIEHDIAQDIVNNNPPPKELCDDAYEKHIQSSREVIMTDGMTLFYESYGGRYFRSNQDAVRKAEKAISDRLKIEDFIKLNELYYEYGISETEHGDEVGFSVSEGLEIYFNSCIAPDGTPCIVINYYNNPAPECLKH